MNKDKLPLKLISLILAILVFLSVNDTVLGKFFQGNASNYTTTWVRNVPLEVTYDKEKYYVVGIPDSVDVRLNGPFAKVQKESIDRTFKVSLDLSSAEVANDQKIKLSFLNLDSDLEAVTNPEFITVSIRDKVARDFAINPVFSSERLLVGSSLNSVKASDDVVKVYGAEESISSIYEVRAESEEKTKLSSSATEVAKLVAYDRNFNKISDVEFEKANTNIVITIDKIEKTLAVSNRTLGTLPSDRELVSITVEPINALVRANSAENLDAINELFVDVDLSSITSDEVTLSNLRVYSDTSHIYTTEPNIVKVNVKTKKK